MRRRKYPSTALLCVAAAAGWLAPDADAALRNKYTFNNGTFADPIVDVQGDNDGTLVDPAGIAAIAGGYADLTRNNGANSNQNFAAPGARGAYIDLPNFTASDAAFFGTVGAFSLEAWFIVQENRNWARLFDFGHGGVGEDEDLSDGAPGGEYLIAVPQTGQAGLPLAASTHSAGGMENFVQDPAGPLPTGIEHHLVVTVDHNSTAGGANPNGTLALYANGALIGTAAVVPGVDFNNIQEVNSWIGRAQWADPLFDGLVNEVRIYDHALSLAEVQANNAAGPDLVNLPVATVNRDTGQISFSNANAAPVQLVAYDIMSAAGGLNPSGWQSIDTGNLFDPDGTWTAQSTTATRIAESGTGDGGTIAAGANPGPGVGAAWMPSIFEDLRVVVRLNDGTETGALVEYVGNNGSPFARSDLNADGLLTVDDWFLFAAGSHTNLSGLSPVAAYLQGDLDGDFDNDYADFRLFKADYIGANGAGAFAALPNLLNTVPEPSSLILAVVGLVFCVRRRRNVG